MEERPKRRRELTDKERKNLAKQQEKEKETARKKAKRDAKYREHARAEARKNGEDSHVVVQIPAAPEKRKKRPKKKTLPDIIEKETDKKVRDLDPTDHHDGYYVNEVGVRKETAKKQKEKRKKAQPKQVTPKQRRRRRIIIYVSIIAAVLIIGIVLSLTVLFKTEVISVEGNKYYEDSQIIELSGIEEGDNIFVAAFFTDTSGISRTLPFVRSARVSFNIPNGVTITVENEQPYYSLKSGGEYFLVSRDNRILEKVDKKPDKLMSIEAPKLKDATPGAFVEFEKDRYTKAVEAIVESLKKNGYEDVTAISVKNINDITITYDNRILIKIGLPDDIDYKIRTAFTIISEKLDPNNAKTIMGILNVSNCNNGKKRSYFREVAIIEDETKPTTKPTKATETTEPSTEEVYDDYDDEDTEWEDVEEETFYDDLYGYYNLEESIAYYGGGDDEYADDEYNEDEYEDEEYVEDDDEYNDEEAEE